MFGEEDEVEDLQNPQNPQDPVEESSEIHHTVSLSGMYKNWFLDYASYVVLERAVPEVTDGLKPVHRRILHSMKELDDGRYNKVANIIGNTMKYHPHGDASIGDALVQLGQKELLVDTQGNWGNVLTGDSAAAPRYIEARLSKFALDVVFNPKTTEWKLSYDGRNKEPVTLPVKFPLLLAQGVEGIAVGLASKILPHNFIELIDASINYLQGKPFEIYPDFPTGGMADISKYNDGLKGGRVRVRAKISQLDKKTLVITEIPYGITTTALIDSVVVANEKGKIKIRKIEDNTAQNVEILVHLAAGVSPDTTIDALYAFTACESSIALYSCVISGSRPYFMGVSDILRKSTDQTVKLLKLELEIQLAESEELWHYASLEKIFIEEKIYRDIEESETWEEVIKAIDKGLDPFKNKLKREVTREDIIKLTEIKIKRISKYDSFKADEVIRSIEDDIDQCRENLNNLIKYSIDYFKRIKAKYSKGRERKTELRSFESIEATMVAAANEKLYVNREEGFAGTGLKKDEYVGECSDIDDIIVFRADGTFVVTKVTDKVFVGKDILHIAVFKKNDDRTIYNMVYADGIRGNVMVKRFPVKGVTRDKEYVLTKGTKGTRVLYFTANPNGEAEVIRIHLKPKPRLKSLVFDFDFSELAIKGRASIGNILTRHAVRKIMLKDEGISTLGARELWFDETVQRLNVENRGKLLGSFAPDQKILTVMQSGHYKITGTELTTHFDEDLKIIEKYNPKHIITSIYQDSATGLIYVKRFHPELSDKKVSYLPEETGYEQLMVTVDYLPRVELIFPESKGKTAEEVNLAEFIGVKGFKAKGKRLTDKQLNKIVVLDPLPYEEPEEAETAEADDSASTVPENNSSFDSDNQNRLSDIDDENSGLQMQLEL